MICRRSPRALPSRRSIGVLGPIGGRPSGIGNFLRVFDTFGERKPSKPRRRANFIKNAFEKCLKMTPQKVQNLTNVSGNLIKGCFRKFVF